MTEYVLTSGVENVVELRRGCRPIFWTERGKLTYRTYCDHDGCHDYQVAEVRWYVKHGGWKRITAAEARNRIAAMKRKWKGEA